MLLTGIAFMIIFAIGYGMGDSQYLSFLFIGSPFLGFGLISEIVFCCIRLGLRCNSVRNLISEIEEGSGMSRTRLDENDARSKSDANVHIQHIDTSSSSFLQIDSSSVNL